MIETGSPVEFAFLVDLDNDGKAREVLPEFGDANMPLAWYEVKPAVEGPASSSSMWSAPKAGDTASAWAT